MDLVHLLRQVVLTQRKHPFAFVAAGSPRRAAIRWLVLPGLIATILQALGCGLFKPRDPIQGKPPVIVRCHALTEPDSLVENVLQFYGSSAGINCYTDMLGGTFVFHPDGQDSLETPAIFQGWDQTVEARDATAVVNSVDSLKVTFDGMYASPTTIPGPPKAEIRYYSYHVLSWKGALPDTIRHQGLADITFRQDAGTDWRIVDWVDRRDGSGFATWGRLRADVRIGF